jgi:DNA helicase HerA-like ATPase
VAVPGRSNALKGKIMSNTEERQSLFDTLNSPPPADGLRDRLQADVRAAGGEITVDPGLAGAIGVTMFDLPGSEDTTVTVLLPREKLQQAPAQALVRIRSRKDGDGRVYLGMVTAGPFSEPDSLRGDSPLLVTSTARGGSYQPPYHGRVQVTILGEELADGTLCPPRLRPLPNSPVMPLSEQESADVLKADGDIRLGLAVGYKNVAVGVPSQRKDVLPRHTAILGTTGGGKSNTVARLVQQAQQANLAIILLDVEGEYARLHQKIENAKMLAILGERGLQAAGIPPEQMALYHLVGRDSANLGHPNRRAFSLQFGRISPYAAAEILGLNEAQQMRFLKAYDIAKEVLRDLGIFPEKGNAEQERVAMELDEFERGYPRLSLSLMMDVVGACLKVAETPKKEGKGRDAENRVDLSPVNKRLATAEGLTSLRSRIYSGSRPDSAVSWRALLGRLARLNRLRVFDVDAAVAKPLIYRNLLKPGTVSVVDLSDSGMSELNNIVIADLLRGVQEAQDAAYEEYESAKKSNPAADAPNGTLIIIEESHEFLSEERVDKMKILFEQVARIAKRGRKRRLGLVFVTQLPQHLPRQVFGLVNSYILHKISDPGVLSNLRRTISGLDESLWNKLPGLAPGQAIASFPHLTRPLMMSVDPSPAELRLVD